MCAKIVIIVNVLVKLLQK